MSAFVFGSALSSTDLRLQIEIRLDTLFAYILPDIDYCMNGKENWEEEERVGKYLEMPETDECDWREREDRDVKTRFKCDAKNQTQMPLLVVAEKRKQILKEGIKEIWPLIRSEQNQTMGSNAPDKAVSYLPSTADLL